MPAEVSSLDRGRGAISTQERATLLPSLSSRAQLSEIERLNVHAARIWAMRDAVLRRDDLLTESFSRELHRRMFNAVWRSAGCYRTTRRDPGWEPERIAEGMGLFFDDAEGWIRCSTYPIHEVAVRLHHRLVSLHPWETGNGRHARLIADIAVAAHGEKPLTWGSGSQASGSARSRYIEAIRAADAGDMAVLVQFARG
jgi:Fic-DOC domain mobile mystery protein B